MFEKPVVFIDIETTGMSSAGNSIIELAAIRVEGNEVIDEFHSLINPGRFLPDFISNLTGIKDSDLIGQPYFEDISGNIDLIFRDAIFIAHNVRFDYSFVKRQMDACGYKFQPKLLCTVRLSRFLYPEVRSHKLESVINRHGIQTSDRHRAQADAYAIWDFCKLAFADRGRDLFNKAVAKQLKLNALPPNIAEDKLAGIKNVPGVYIFEDIDGKPLYIGKSISLRKRIMSHFTQDTKIDKEMNLSLGVHDIKTIETGSELEALLLESKLIKEMLPLYNRRLRRSRKHVALVKSENKDGYSTISINDVVLAECQDLSSLYGIFETRGKAKNALNDMQKTYSICPKLLGLEKGSGPCFQYHLHKCSGACAGEEKAEQHNLKVELALERIKIAAWPYKGPVLVSDKSNPSTGLIVDQWRISGEYSDQEGEVKNQDNIFDLDTYKILRSFLINNQSQLRIQPYKA